LSNLELREHNYLKKEDELKYYQQNLEDDHEKKKMIMTKNLKD